MEELYNEIMGNDDLKVAFVTATKADGGEGFLRGHDCDATVEELNEFIQAKMTADGPMELDMDQLAEIAGGSAWTQTVGCSEGETCECSDTCIEDCC